MGGGAVGGGGGGGRKLSNFFFTTKFIFSKNVPGVLRRQTKFFGVGGGADFGGAPYPPGGHAGSENDALLPLIITHDRRKFWNDPP